MRGRHGIVGRARLDGKGRKTRSTLRRARAGACSTGLAHHSVREKGGTASKTLAHAEARTLSSSTGELWRWVVVVVVVVVSVAAVVVLVTTASSQTCAKGRAVAESLTATNWARSTGKACSTADHRRMPQKAVQTGGASWTVEAGGRTPCRFQVAGQDRRLMTCSVQDLRKWAGPGEAAAQVWVPT